MREQAEWRGKAKKPSFFFLLPFCSFGWMEFAIKEKLSVSWRVQWSNVKEELSLWLVLFFSFIIVLEIGRAHV